MPVCDWERTITCPYNPSHQITVERIQWHLVKCRKNYPSSDHVICPFNASHHVPRPEKEYHMSVCSDRKMVEMEKYSLRSNSVLHQQGNVNLPPPVVGGFTQSVRKTGKRKQPFVSRTIPVLKLSSQQC